MIKQFKEWRKRRYWQARQLEHLRLLIQSDARWLAHDKNISAVLARYEAALQDDWYTKSYEDSAQIRERLGLTPKYGNQP